MYLTIPPHLAGSTAHAVCPLFSRVLSPAGDGLGGYENDSRGIHHISPLACVQCEANDDAFGWLEVYEDKLRLHMAGSLQPDASRLPSGWPRGDLPLPGGGALSAGSTGDMTGVVGFFMWLSFFMFRAISTPLNPVLRMLTQSPYDLAGNAGNADAAGASDAAHLQSAPSAAQAEQSEQPPPAQPPTSADSSGGNGASSSEANEEAGIVV